MTPVYYVAPAILTFVLILFFSGDIVSATVPPSMALILLLTGSDAESFTSGPIGRPLYSVLLPKIREKLRRGMVFVSSRDVAKRASIALAGALILTPACVLAALAAGAPIATLGAVPAALPLITLLPYFTRAGHRREWTESELPFFTTVAVALVSAGMSFYYVLKRCAELPHLFKQIRREAHLVIRNVELIGMGVLEAMDAVASEHPSEQFRSLLFTITGVTRTGGSVRQALVDRGREALLMMRKRWEVFAGRMKTLGELSVIVFMVLPMALSVSAIAFASVAFQGMLVMNIMILPSLGVMTLILVVSYVPRVYDIYSPPKALLPMTIGVGIGISLLSYLILSQILPTRAVVLSFLSGVGVASLLSYLIMRGQIAEVKSSDEQIARLLREIVEARKSGEDIYDAVRNAAVSGRYSGPFGKVLKRIAARMLMFPPSQSAASARSWSTRMAFFMMDEIETSGGGSPVLLEGVIEALSAYSLSRREGASSVRLYMVLAMMFPLITLFATSMILSIAGQLSFTQAAQQVRFATPVELESVVQMSWFSVTEAGIFMTLAIGRGIDLSFYGSWRVALFCGLTAATILAQPILLDALSALFSAV